MATKMHTRRLEILKDKEENYEKGEASDDDLTDVLGRSDDEDFEYNGDGDTKLYESRLSGHDELTALNDTLCRIREDND